MVIPSSIRPSKNAARGETTEELFGELSVYLDAG